MAKVLFIYKNQVLAEPFVEQFVKNGYDLEILFKEKLYYNQFSVWQRLINIFHRNVLKNNFYYKKVSEYYLIIKLILRAPKKSFTKYNNINIIK